ncbi:hypothetical protein ACQ4PT_031164 [Festuca glaucescens]
MGQVGGGDPRSVQGHPRLARHVRHGRGCSPGLRRRRPPPPRQQGQGQLPRRCRRAPAPRSQPQNRAETAMPSGADDGVHCYGSNIRTAEARRGGRETRADGVFRHGCFLRPDRRRRRAPAGQGELLRRQLREETDGRPGLVGGEQRRRRAGVRGRAGVRSVHAVPATLLGHVRIHRQLLRRRG